MGDSGGEFENPVFSRLWPARPIDSCPSQRRSREKKKKMANGNPRTGPPGERQSSGLQIGPKPDPPQADHFPQASPLVSNLWVESSPGVAVRDSHPLSAIKDGPHTRAEEYFPQAQASTAIPYFPPLPAGILARSHRAA